MSVVCVKMAKAIVQRLADIGKFRINGLLRHAKHAELFEDVRLGLCGDADESDLRDAVGRRVGVVVVVRREGRAQRLFAVAATEGEEQPSLIADAGVVHQRLECPDLLDVFAQLFADAVPIAFRTEARPFIGNLVCQIAESVRDTGVDSFSLDKRQAGDGRDGVAREWFHLVFGDFDDTDEPVVIWIPSRLVAASAAGKQRGKKGVHGEIGEPCRKPVVLHSSDALAHRAVVDERRDIVAHRLLIEFVLVLPE